MDRGADGRAAERRGGWGAWAVAAFGVLKLAALVLMVARPPRFAAAPVLLLILSDVGGAAGQAFAVEGLRRRLGAPTRLSWTAAAAGWAGAGLAFAESVKIGLQGLRAPGAAALSHGLLRGWLAAFATALWVAGACADDWRRGRLSPGLRVLGTIFAVLSLAAAVLPPLGAPALPFAVAWWLGLGFVLLRTPRSTSG